MSRVDLKDSKIVFEIDSLSGETRPGEIDVTAGDLLEPSLDSDETGEPDAPGHGGLTAAVAGPGHLSNSPVRERGGAPP